TQSIENAPAAGPGAQGFDQAWQMTMGSTVCRELDRPQPMAFAMLRPQGSDRALAWPDPMRLRPALADRPPAPRLMQDKRRNAEATFAPGRDDLGAAKAHWICVPRGGILDAAVWFAHT